jgi:hypothetical protein
VKRVRVPVAEAKGHEKVIDSWRAGPLPGADMSRRLALPLALACIAAFSACSSDPNEPDAVVAVLEFDGANDYVMVPDNAALALTEQVTVAAWFHYSSVIVGEPGLIQKDGPGSYGRYGLWVLGDKIDFCIYIDSGIQTCMVSTGTLTPDAWNHVAGTYNGIRMRLYINGELDSSETLAGAISTSEDPLFIGGDPTETQHLAGRLHEVQLWSVARTEEQIAGSMDTRLTGDEAGLVGYWPMDEGTGQIVADVSANGLDGTLGASSASEASDPAWTTATWPHP